MAFDVANFISYMQRRVGDKKPDKMARHYALLLGIACMLPVTYLVGKHYQRGLMAYRKEIYAVRDGKYYNHFRHG